MSNTQPTERMRRIRLEAIDVGDRLRRVEHELADQIATSMREIGQLQPIEVAVADASGRYRLISGAHRLQAAMSLGWQEIDAQVFDGDADEARLREIDENLYRHELTPFDQATFLAERRAIFERRKLLKKFNRSFRDEKGPRFGLNEFVEETKKKFNLGRSTIFKALQRRANIDPELWEALRKAPWEKKGADLDRLAGLDEDEQREVALLLFGEHEANEGRPTTLSAAIAMIARPRNNSPQQPQKERQQALKKAWNEATDGDREWLIVHLIKDPALVDEVCHALSVHRGRRDGRGESGLGAAARAGTRDHRPS